MTVFIIQQDNNKDFSAAKKYGKLDFIFSRGVFPDDHEKRSSDMEEIARAKLRGFDPSTDFLLLNGDPVGIAVAVSVIKERVRSFTVLKWDKEASDYYRVIVMTAKIGDQHD